MVFNYNNNDNYSKGRWLEYPVYETYAQILLSKCGSIQVDNCPTSNIERVIYAPATDPTWKAIWYRPNQGTKPALGSRPDFEIFDGNQCVQAVECKNLNSNFEIYGTWFDDRIGNRFIQRSQYRLLIISYWNTYPNHQSYLNTQLSSLKLDVLSLGKQVTLDDDADVRVRLLSDPVFRKPFP